METQTPANGSAIVEQPANDYSFVANLKNEIVDTKRDSVLGLFPTSLEESAFNALNKYVLENPSFGVITTEKQQMKHTAQKAVEVLQDSFASEGQKKYWGAVLEDCKKGNAKAAVYTKMVQTITINGEKFVKGFQVKEGKTDYNKNLAWLQEKGYMPKEVNA